MRKLIITFITALSMAALLPTQTVVTVAGIMVIVTSGIMAVADQPGLAWP